MVIFGGKADFFLEPPPGKLQVLSSWQCSLVRKAEIMQGFSGFGRRQARGAGLDFATTSRLKPGGDCHLPLEGHSTSVSHGAGVPPSTPKAADPTFLLSEKEGPV